MSIATATDLQAPGRFGVRLCIILEYTGVVEIMRNPDGKIFIERLGYGTTPASRINTSCAEVISSCVAQSLQSEVNEQNAIVSGRFSIGAHRFEGLLQSIVASPMLSIRRRASRQISLGGDVMSGVMTARQAGILCSAINSRLNIVISGGTRSDKATLANAIIAHMFMTQQQATGC